MKRQVRKSSLAQIDMFEIARYIAASNFPAAQRFIKATEKTFRQLLKNPALGFAGEYQLASGEELRRWPVEGFRNYQIFYRDRAEGIEIVRVLHGSRDLETVFEVKT